MSCPVQKKTDFSIDSLLRIPYQCQARESSREKLSVLSFTNCFPLKKDAGRNKFVVTHSYNSKSSVYQEEGEGEELEIEELEPGSTRLPPHKDNEDEEEESHHGKSESDEQSDEGVEKEKELSKCDRMNNLEEMETLSEAEESNSKEFSWLYCSRFKPPKLPRSKKRGGCKRYGRGPRIPFAPHQISVLENAFKKSQYLSSDCIGRLADSLLLSENRVKIWFQNRRARFRRENSDQDMPSVLMDKQVSSTEPILNSSFKNKTSSSLVKSSHVQLSKHKSFHQQATFEAKEEASLEASRSHGSQKKKVVVRRYVDLERSLTNSLNSTWTTRNNVVDLSSPKSLSLLPLGLEQHHEFVNEQVQGINSHSTTNTCHARPDSCSNKSCTSINNSPADLNSHTIIINAMSPNNDFIPATFSPNAHFNRIIYGSSSSAFAPIRR